MAALFRRVKKYVFGEKLGGETIRYVIAGALSTMINFGLFELLYNVVGVGLTDSNLASISVSILFAYILNKLIVFRKPSESVTALMLEFCKFVGSRLFTMVLEVGFVELSFNVFGMDARLGKLSAMALVIIVNYLFSKLVVFKKAQ